MQYEDAQAAKHLPEPTPASLSTAQALCSEHSLILAILGFSRNINTIFLRASTSDVVESEFRETGNVLKSKEAQLMQVFVGTVADNSHDSEIGFTRVIDKARWAGHEFTVNFVWFIFEACIFGLWVVELVEGEQIEILLILVLGLLSAAVGFCWGEDFANVFVDELSFPDIFPSTNPPASTVAGAENLDIELSTAAYDTIWAVFRTTAEV